MEKGKFIVFEGLDCSGKTTQLELLFERLSNKINVTKHTNISDGILGKCIREITLLHKDYLVNPEQIAGLYIAELHHVCDLINKDLNDGKHVICSRHMLSTLTYAGDTLESIQGIMSLGKTLIQPDLTVFIDMNLKTVKDRMVNKENADYWENVNKQKYFMEKYYESISRLRECLHLDIKVVNGDKSIKDLHEDIYSFVCSYFNWDNK